MAEPFNYEVRARTHRAGPAKKAVDLTNAIEAARQLCEKHGVDSADIMDVRDGQTLRFIRLAEHEVIEEL